MKKLILFLLSASLFATITVGEVNLQEKMPSSESAGTLVIPSDNLSLFMRNRYFHKNEYNLRYKIGADSEVYCYTKGDYIVTNCYTITPSKNERFTIKSVIYFNEKEYSLRYYNIPNNKMTLAINAIRNRSMFLIEKLLKDTKKEVTE